MAFPVVIGGDAQPDTGFGIVIGDSGSGSMLDFTVPSAELNSVLMIVITRDSTVECSDSTWTKVIDGVGASGVFLDAWVRTVDGTSGSNAGNVISFVSTVTQDLLGDLLVITNADATALVYDVQHAVFTATTTPAAPIVAAAQDFDTVLCIWSAGAVATFTPPTGFTELEDYSSGSRSLSIASRTSGDVADIDPGTATASTSITGRAFTLAIHHLAEPPGVTLTKMATGNGSFKWVAAIEGYDSLLTDANTDAVVTAWTGTGYQSALGGLHVQYRREQAINPWDPFESTGGSLTLQVQPDSFGVDTHLKSGGAETLSTLSVDCDDTTITVASTASFDLSGDLYIGTEAMEYAAKTGTTFTGVTRGKFSPFVTDTAGNFCHPHTISSDPTTVTIPCVVSSAPRQWIGKWVGLWRHLYNEASSLLNIKEDALCVYAGRIAEIRDNPETMTTDVDVRHVLEYVRNHTFGEAAWQAEITEGITLVEGVTVAQAADFDGATVKTADPLVVVAGTPASAYEIQAGRYPLTQVIGFINAWFGQARTDGDLTGIYRFGIGALADGITHGAFVRRMNAFGGGGGIGAFVSVEVNYTVARAMGFIQAGSFNNYQFTRGFPAAATSYREHSSFGALRSIGEATEIINQTGEFYDQSTNAPPDLLALLPVDPNTGADLVGEVGIVMVGDTKAMIIRKDGSTMVSMTGFDLTTGAKIEDAADVPYDEPQSTKLRQVVVVKDTFGNFAKKLFHSTGTTGHNHATWDVYPAILGLGIPADLLDAQFTDSVDRLPHADVEMTIVLDRPQKLVDLIGAALKLRFAFLRWYQGHLEFFSWMTPTTGVTLDEANKASPVGNRDEQRSVSRLSDQWTRNVINIDYDRNFSLGGDDAAYNKHVTIIDRAGIDDAGGARRVETIPDPTSYAQSFLGGGGVLDGVIDHFKSIVPMFTRPVRTSKRTIAPTMFEHVTVGDCVLVSDAFARDPDTGARGVAVRPGIVVAHGYELGGWAPNSNDADPMHGEVEILFLDLLRVAPYVPSANVASYNSGTLTISCEQRDYAVSPETADAAQVASAAGRKIRIVERDPSDPAAPLSWDRIVASQSGFDIVITADLTSPAYDATKSYRVIWDDYTDAVAAQQAFAYQADDADYRIADSRAPYKYTANTNLRDLISADAAANTASDAVELPPNSSYGDGVGLDVGTQVAINRLANNLYDYKTATSAPILWRTAVTVLGDTTHEWVTVAVMPIFLGSDLLPSSIIRKLYVAPMWSSSTGSTVNARISLSTSLPTVTGGVPLPKSSKIFTTTSTTLTTSTAQGLSIGPVKDGWGVAYLTLELQVPTAAGSTIVTCQGIATAYQGPRE